MKCKPSKITRPTPVNTCHNQAVVAFGSSANESPILLTSKDFERGYDQCNRGYQHQDPKKCFLRPDAYFKACQRNSQAVKAVNKYSGEQNHIQCKVVRRT